MTLDRSPTLSGGEPFDVARITALLTDLDAEKLAPIVRKAADEFYDTVMSTAQDYLAENLDHNLSVHIKMLERENTQMRAELWDADCALRSTSMGHERRMKAIGELNRRANNAIDLAVMFEDCIDRIEVGDPFAKELVAKARAALAKARAS